MELKHIITETTLQGTDSFNRTFMELKLNSVKAEAVAQASFNRTFMELKQYTSTQRSRLGGL